ncbi:hypothetical protein Pla52n_29080 [Stieleria varia]|uniref:Uncharacterized protein n=2 Tax=Stieleria varia TaxID=2528005 RepID=A0A5C6AY46_9BACT|nr:hypothetical protein Pla52n_29080 [Stieleria varia]
MLAADLTNPGNPLDVNNDLRISALDALHVINDIARIRAAEGQVQVAEGELAPDNYVDVTGDDRVSALDALQIINAMYRRDAEITFRLAHDTDREQMGRRDERTYDLTIQGRVNFGDGDKTVFIGIEQNGQLTWIDLTPNVDEEGYFELTDRQVRAMLTDVVGPGSFEILFSPDGTSTGMQDIEIELLVSPPRPELTEAAIPEDGSATFDITGAIYDPDSDPASLQVTIAQQPAHGTLTIDAGMYLYQPVENFFGIDTIVYEVSDEQDSSGPVTLTIDVQSVNDLPEVSPITDQVIRYDDGSIRLPLSLFDIDDTTLEYVGYATVANHLYEIRSTYGLNFASEEAFNLVGLNEKWFFGNDGTSFLLLPDGDLVQWLGEDSDATQSELLIAKLSPEIYADPELLSRAAQEILAPATVSVTDDWVVVIPDPGLYGTITINISVVDATDGVVSRFDLELTPPGPELQKQLDRVDSLIAAAAQLSLENTPQFLQSVAGQLDSFAPELRSQLTEMLTQVLFDYEQTVKLQIASEDWRLIEEAETKRELATAQWVDQQLAILKTNYESAISQYGDSMLADNPAHSAPPLFVQGIDYSEPIQVRVGDTFELDFRAIHPDEVGFFYALDGYDQAKHGYLPWSPQTGLFTWYNVPKEAIGSNQFTMRSWRPGEDTEASVTFTIVVSPDETSLELLTVSPKTISDLGTDPVTLTARGAWHPEYSGLGVEFYQDADGNGVFNRFIDRYLGRDEDGSDGWTWTGTPLPGTGASSVKFFARSVWSSIDEIVSPAVSVEADVIAVPRLQASVLAADGGVTNLNSYEDGDLPHEDHIVRYPNGDSVIASSVFAGQDGGIYLTRYSNSGIDGTGTAKGPAVRVAPSGFWKYEITGDAAGNILLVTSYDSFTPDGTNDPGVFLFRIDPDDNVIGDPIRLDGQTNDGFTFTSAMNSSGQGFVAWKETYVSQPIYIQTFSQAGGNLHDVQILDLHGGFHDGSQWDSSAINEAGDYVIAWPNQAAIGNVAEPDSMRVILHEMYPFDAAINDDGWFVLANAGLQVFDPDGRLVGEPVSVFPSNGRSIQRQVEFLDNDTLRREYVSRSGDSGPRYYRRQSFQLLTHPALMISESEITSLSQQVPQAGSQIDVRVSIENTASESSDSITVAYYLSHDGMIDGQDRLLGSMTIDSGITGNQTQSFDKTLTLPPQVDPFYSRGSTELSLITQVVGSGDQMATALPFIELDFAQLLGAKLDELDAIMALEPPDQPTRIDPLHQLQNYIDPLAVQQQLFGGAGYSNQIPDAINMFQLLGYQYLAGLRAIASRAPYTMREGIYSLGLDVEGAIDRFESEQFQAAQWEEEQLQLALDTRNAKATAAQSQKNATIKKAAERGNQLLDEKDAKIESVRNSKSQRETEKLTQWNRDLSEAENDLASLDDSEESIERINQKLDSTSFSLSWSGAIDYVVEKGKNAQDCVGDLVACGEQVAEETKTFFQGLSEHYQGLYVKAKNQLDARIADLNDQISRVGSIVQSEINRAIATIVEQKRKIKEKYDETVANAEAKRKKLADKAEAEWEKAKTDIAAAKDDLVEFTEAKAAPVLQKGLDAVSDRIDDLRSPAGILQSLQDDLQQLDTINPFGTLAEIASTIETTVTFAGEILGEVKQQLEPAVQAIKEAGGEFADWAKDTGGEVAQQVKDNLLSVFNEEIVAYKVETGFDMTLNLGNGSIFIDANIAPGIDYDSRKFFDLLQGNISFPDLDPIEVITNLLGVELVIHNNYDTIRDSQYAEFGATNVYFSSERFVEYFGGETLLGDAVEIVATGGSAAKDAITDLANQLRLEFNDLFSWLELKGQEQFDSIVPGLFKALITQTPFESPHLELRWTPVTYRYELDFSDAGGKLAKLNPLQQLATDQLLESDYVKSLIDGLNLNVDSPHAAFTLVWKIPEGIDPPTLEEINAEIDANLQDFDFDDFSGLSITGELIDLTIAELKTQGLPEVTGQILGELAKVIIGEKQIEAVVAGQIAGRLDFDFDFIRTELDQFRLQNLEGYKLDLRGTPAGIRLAEFFDRITFGNVGTAMLDELSFDLTTFTLKVSGTLCHKHSWGSLADIIGV